MAAACAVFISAVFASVFVPGVSESRVGFLGHQGDDSNDDVVNVEYLEQSLRDSMDAVLSGGSGMAGERLAAIEASTWPTFQALPKNSLGRISPRAVRHIVHAYFAKEHGWLINGLEPHGMTANVTEVHHVDILKDKAPALVEALVEARQQGRGLALSDVVAMIAALEQLIFSESLDLLHAAYNLNGRSPRERLDASALHEVLRSYLVVFGQGHQADLTNIQKHQDMKASFNWPELDDFQYDIVLNFDYKQRNEANPFARRTYVFGDVMRIVTSMAQTYGKWQNAECSAMKEHLMDLDPEGSGRIPLSIFHTQPEGSVYQFTESRAYLRQVGALDETVKDNPRVLIANYVAGPSNCIASSSYYSVCCLNECGGLLSELEGMVRAPKASPGHLLSLVGNLSSPTVDAPRALPQALVEKLHGIADNHGGMVPLQGRLFAQWLHYAFPNECPYPSIVSSSASLTAHQWLGGKSAASLEERQLAGSATDAARQGVALGESSTHLSQWSNDEVLPLHEPHVSFSVLAWIGVFLRRALRVAACVGALYLVGQAALAAGQAARYARSCDDSDKKEQNCVPNMHV